MNILRTLVLWVLAGILISCGGKKTTETPKPPPPPIDVDLLNLVPYEADLVAGFHMTMLKSSPAWELIERILTDKNVPVPVDTSLAPPLFACDQVIMAYLHSPNAGDQLLAIANGAPDRLTALAQAFSRRGAVTPVSVESFQGVLSSKILFLPLTEKTAIFGDEAIVRMSVKAGLGKTRSVRANARFNEFDTDQNAALTLRYRSDGIGPMVEKLRPMVPRIKPSAVTGLDATLYAQNGFDLKLAVSTQTQMDASMISNDLKHAMSSLKNNMFVVFLGLTWVMDRIAISTDKTVININVILDNRDIVELGHLVERLQKIQQLLDDRVGPALDVPAGE